MPGARTRPLGAVRPCWTAARQAVGDLVNADPRGVVLGADRAVLLRALADASASRAGLGYEMVVTRLDDEANIAPWLRAANRHGARIKWAEVDIETGDLPAWQWESLITEGTRLVAIASASSTLGTVNDLRAVTKLVHDAGGVVVVDHSAAAPYRLMDINEIDADVVAVNAVGWGGPPIGALAFREPAMIDTFASMSLAPNATGPGRLETGVHQFGLLAGVVASIEYLAGLDESASGTRRQRLAISMQSASLYMDRVFDYLHGVAALTAPGDGAGAAGGAHPGGQLRGERCAGGPRGATPGRQRDLRDRERAVAGARSDRRQRCRGCGVAGARALFDDVRGGPVGPRARVTRLTA